MRSHECPASKHCSKCGEEKLLSEFYLSKGKPFSQCKSCYAKVTKAWADANKERKKADSARRRLLKAGEIKQYMADYYRRNRWYILEKTQAYQDRPEVKARETHRHRARWLANRDAIMASRRARLNDPKKKAESLEYGRDHYRRNKSAYLAKWAKRRAAKLRATPSWADEAKMTALYERAAHLTQLTGIVHEVDHIVPLQGRNVSGLHVENNLRIVTWLENRRKSNRLEGDIV